jgi:hypothetical protein
MADEPREQCGYHEGLQIAKSNVNGDNRRVISKAQECADQENSLLSRKRPWRRNFGTASYCTARSNATKYSRTARFHALRFSLDKRHLQLG